MLYGIPLLIRERAQNWSSFGLALHLLCIGAETSILPKGVLYTRMLNKILLFLLFLIQTITKQLQIQLRVLSLLRKMPGDVPFYDSIF